MGDQEGMHRVRGSDLEFKGTEVCASSSRPREGSLRVVAGFLVVNVTLQAKKQHACVSLSHPGVPAQMHAQATVSCRPSILW